MITTLFATIDNVSSRPPRLIRSAGGYFYQVCFSDSESFDGFILWNGEVFRVRQICGTEEFHDRMKND